MPSKGRLSYNLEGIASLLKQHEFRVSTYQRSYAWDASETSEQTLAVDDFWNDLSEALNGNEPDYFLGSRQRKLAAYAVKTWPRRPR